MRPWRPWAWTAYRRYLQLSRRPVIVGPFYGEVGFEALYWVPFVRALGLDPARLLTLTRGGASVLYPAAGGTDIYTYRSEAEVRIQNRRLAQQTGLMKQTHVSAFDRQLLADVRKAEGWEDALLLHPAWMYQTLAPYWAGHRGLSWLYRQMDPRPWSAPPLPDGLTLPADYHAMRWYYRSTFPVGKPTQQVAAAVLQQAAQLGPVVLLEQPFQVDEHLDVPLTVQGPNIVRLRDLYPGLTVQNQLGVQAAVLARAQGFLGPYGGLAQLALKYRIPVLSLYWEWQGTSPAHWALSENLAMQQRSPFVVLQVAHLQAIQALLPRIQVHP